MGAVRKPGTFQIRGSKTLLEVLSLAEGLAEDAGGSGHHFAWRRSEQCARVSCSETERRASLFVNDGPAKRLRGRA